MAMTRRRPSHGLFDRSDGPPTFGKETGTHGTHGEQAGSPPVRSLSGSSVPPREPAQKHGIGGAPASR
ncbi:hypothetical protein DO72_4443 [Burkholderia pseudomallei]|nr:hypothetical protein DO72_4443 [Burkholderia pseudomallei]